MAQNQNVFINAALKEVLQLTIQKKAPFCVFRTPRSTTARFAFADQAEEISFGQIFDPTGQNVVVAPFDAHKLFLLKQHGLAHLAQVKETLQHLADPVPEREPEFASTSKAVYLQTMGQYLKMIRSGEVSKAILSRLHVVPRPEKFDPLEFFTKLCQTYTNAFCYLLYIPQYGMWCGATPEILLTAKNSSIKTVALAGTQPVQENVLWGEKEKQEQELVSLHIREALTTAGFSNFSESKPRNIIAGQVMHLKSDFEVAAADKAQLAQLLQNLHPTPAVAGLPKQQAIAFINQTEPHSRGLYTGFLGPVNSQNDFDIYVNLRCMRITSQQLILYLGGGITADSDPESEWRETENKSKTLLNIIERRQHS